MSKTIDEKIVRVEFDNENFEKNVKQTMGTLDRLKSKIDLSKLTKGFEKFTKTSNSINLNGVEKAMDTIQTRLSKMGVTGTVVMARLANSALNVGKNIASAFTVKPIKTGFDEYELKIGSIQTILSNTAKDGTKLEEVNKVLDELNTYADKTIYNFAEMTRNIGTFTAAGIKLKPAAAAIQGIANLAAASGSTSQQASTAMYQISQALAAGRVQLMDWNSVVNAGMGGRLFQDALKETAREHGVAVDKIIEKEGSFRESLKYGWISAEIMTKTLDKFTVDGAKRYAAAMKKSGKYTEAQANALIQQAQNMEDAATKVKKFTQLMSTLDEAAQSGWSRSWEIIIGDFNEAQALWTGVYKVLGGIIDKSSDARNEILSKWKDLGGRTEMLKAFANVWKSILAIIDPIKKAFRDMFPKQTGDNLYELTKRFKSFTDKMIIGKKTADKLYNTFKGVFAILKTAIKIVFNLAKAFVTVIKALFPINELLLDVTSGLGIYAERITRSIRESNAFSKTLNVLYNAFSNVSSAIMKIIKSMFSFKKLNAVFEGIFDFLSRVGLAINSVLRDIIKDGDIEHVANIFNSGLLGGVLLSVNKFIKSLSDSVKNLGSTFKDISSILKQTGAILESYQDNLNSGTLMRIAIAIGILCTSLLLLSTIDPDKLWPAFGAMAATSMMQLLGLFKMYTQIADKAHHAIRASTLMLSMGASILLLSKAFKNFSGLNWSQVASSLTAMSGCMALLIGALHLLPKKDILGRTQQSIRGLIPIVISIYIMGKTLRLVSGIKWESLISGLIAMGSTLLILSRTIKNLAKNAPKKKIGTVALLGSVTSLVILAGALKILATMSWSDILRSLVTMSAALTVLTIFIKNYPTNSILGFNKTAPSFIGSAVSLVILAGALKILATMSWDDIKRSLTTMAGAMTILVVALNLMKGTAMGSVSLLTTSAALVVLAGALKLLGTISWKTLAKDAIALIGVFAIMGGSAALLSPLIPVIISLSGAMALFGLGVSAFGAGLILISSGITALAVALATSTASIVAGLTGIILGILGTVPKILEIIYDTIIGVCKILKEAAPLIVDTVVTIIWETVKLLGKYIPKIADVLFDAIIEIIHVITNKTPEMVMSLGELVNSFFASFMAAMELLDINVIMNGSKALLMITGALILMGGLAALSPLAAIGIIAFGLLVSELVKVLSVLGKHVSDSKTIKNINKSGEILIAIADVIGSAIGTLIGSMGNHLSKTLPSIADNLSDFMDKLQGFISGSKNISADMIPKISALSGVIVLLSGSSFINGIANFLSIGHSLPTMGKDLSDFMNESKDFIDMAYRINPTLSKNIKALSTGILYLTATKFISGISRFLIGDISYKTFGENLSQLADGLKSFTKNLGKFKNKDVTKIKLASDAITELSKASSKIPKTGGLKQLLSGKNNLSELSKALPNLGTNLSSFVEHLGEFNNTHVNTIKYASKALAEMASASSKIPKTGGLKSLFSGDNNLSDYSKEIPKLAKALSDFSKELKDFSKDASDKVILAANCVAVLAKASSEIPNTGGLWSRLAGDNSLASFSTKLPLVGWGITTFAKNVNKLNDNALMKVDIASKSITTLANASKNIPRTKGLWGWLVGNKSLASFATKLPLVGWGINNFASSLNSFSEEKSKSIDLAVNSIYTLSKASKNIDSKSIIDSFGKLIDTSIFSSTLPSLGEGINSFIDKIKGIDDDKLKSVECAVNALKKLSDASDIDLSLIERISGTTNLALFSENFDSIGRGIVSFVKALTTKDSTFDESKVAIVDCASRAISSLAKSANDIKSESLWELATTEYNMSSFSKNMPKLGTGISGFVNALKGVTNEKISIVDTSIKIIKAISSFASKDTLENLSDYSKDLKVDLVNVGDAFSKYIGKIDSIKKDKLARVIKKNDNILNMIQKSTSIDTEGINTFIKTIENLTKNSVAKLIKSYGTESDKTSLAQKVRSLLGVISTTINAMSGTLSNDMRKAVTRSISVIKNREMHDKIYSAGVYFVNGFCDGINDKTYLASESGRALGEAAYESAKRALDEHSPSKKGFKLGSYFGLGFINGINSNNHSVSNAGTIMAEKAINGVKTAASTINELLTSVDNTPVIRPVLDLSDIEHNAQSLSGMFGNVKVKTIASNISNDMKYNQKIKRDLDLVNAISKLDNTSKSGDTYNINGITYSSGNEIADAVQTLVHAALIERRS